MRKKCLLIFDLSLSSYQNQKLIQSKIINQWLICLITSQVRSSCPMLRRTFHVKEISLAVDKSPGILSVRRTPKCKTHLHLFNQEGEVTFVVPNNLFALTRKFLHPSQPRPVRSIEGFPTSQSLSAANSAVRDQRRPGECVGIRLKL
mmetsp:Transcript_28640/g.92386  ORF Transcript_28640/g.92386 Transcript_28640/m.92386 type:complete len:147 (-) Transcript_28640:89-529(-)